jgi:hypothetical protein
MVTYSVSLEVSSVQESSIIGQSGEILRSSFVTAEEKTL